MIMMGPDTNALRRLIWLRGNPATGGGGGSPLTVTGATPLLLPGAVAKPLRAATFSIEALQAGSGDPSPQNIRAITGWTGCTAWVTGKNLLNLNRTQGTPVPADYSGQTKPRVMSTENYFKGMTRDNYYNPNAVTEFSIGENSVTVKSSSSGYGIGFPVSVKGGTKYTFSGGFDNVNYGCAYYDKDWMHLSYSAAKTETATLTMPDNCAYCVIVINAVTAGTSGTLSNPMFEPGDVAHSYTPYSVTMVSVEFPAMGTNQWDEEWEPGALDIRGKVSTSSGLDTRRTSSFIPIVPGQTYYQCCPHSAGAGRVAYYDAKKDLISFNSSGISANAVITPAPGSYYMRITFGGSYGTTYNHDIAINYPATVTTYEAYKGRTIYGGTIDPVTGEGVMTHKMVDMGSLTWSKGLSTTETYYTFDCPKINDKANNVNFICSIYKAVDKNRSQLADNEIGVYYLGGDYYKRLYIRDDAHENDDAATFTAAVTGQTICYELAEHIPFTIAPQPLTPPAGDAYIWADCGSSAEITYIGKA